MPPSPATLNMPEPIDNPRARRSSALTVDRVEIEARTVVVAVEGDLDLWSSPQLKRVLCDEIAAGRRIVVDLSRVAFMDSTALGVLVGLHRRLTREDRMAIAAARPEVLRLFELSGIASAFRVFATREAGLAYVTEGRSAATSRATPPLTADAALMLGIVSTAMPFAQSAEDQAERWLRVLRHHGETGALLASLGMSEAPVAEPDPEDSPGRSGRGDSDAVATVSTRASSLAAARGAPKLGTIDVLRAVVQVYGATFHRVLAAHGVDPAELSARLADTEPAPAES
jgi:anti-sigma B factor antagonist